MLEHQECNQPSCQQAFSSLQAQQVFTSFALSFPSSPIEGSKADHVVCPICHLSLVLLVVLPLLLLPIPCLLRLMPSSWFIPRFSCCPPCLCNLLLVLLCPSGLVVPLHRSAFFCFTQHAFDQRISEAPLSESPHRGPNLAGLATCVSRDVSEKGVVMPNNGH